MPHVFRLCCLVLLCGLAVSAAAQPLPEPEPPRRYFQLGLGLLPGAGVQTGYITPYGFATLEGAFYARIKPDFNTGQGDFLLTFGLGGSLQITRILTEFDLAPSPGYDVNVGARLGPSFAIPYNSPDPIDRTRVFSLFFEPFARLARTYPSGRVIYAEVGLQSPIIRAGLMFGI